MPTINLNFDKKSISNAIKKIADYQVKFKYDVPYNFVKSSCEWIINRANENISAENLDARLIDDIIQSWRVPEINFSKGNTIIAKCVNNGEKAVYLEFGVGIVGEQNSHPLADINGYQYNTEGKKDKTGMWWFTDKSSDTPIDLKDGYYQRSRNGRAIITRGSPSILYLYNAITDYMESGEYLKIWQNSLEKILK